VPPPPPGYAPAPPPPPAYAPPQPGAPESYAPPAPTGQPNVGGSDILPKH